MKKEPSGAEKMFGGFAPKLVELTHDESGVLPRLAERNELHGRSERTL
jgi:hypothetical protein